MVSLFCSDSSWLWTMRISRKVVFASHSLTISSALHACYYTCYLILNSNELARKLWRPSAYGLDGRLLEFLHKGADPDRYLPLHEACLANQPRCAELLIKWGASLSLVDAYGQTPLHWACKNNSLDCARVLMSHNSPTGESEFVCMCLVVCIGDCQFVHCNWGTFHHLELPCIALESQQ